MRYPTGLFIQGDELFVADGRNNAVEIYGLDGVHRQRIAIAWDPATEPEPAPYDVAVSPDGQRLYVSLMGLDTVGIYDRAGQRLGTVANPTIDGQTAFTRTAVDVDREGYVCSDAVFCYASVDVRDNS